MNTSGVAAPPEMVVTRVARLVSVLVGAVWISTLIVGLAFSKALTSTVRRSGPPLDEMGLAHQVIVVVVAAEAVPGTIAIRPTATMAVAVTIERVSPRRARPLSAMT